MKIIFEGNYEILDFDPVEAENWAYQELKTELTRLIKGGQIPHEKGVNPHAVGIHDVEGWCIAREGRYWLIYLAERGKRSQVSIFLNPFNAANYFLWSLLSHPAKGNSDIGRLPIRRSDG
jgi:hypothetical protein